MQNLSEAAVSKEAIALSVDEWFDKFGVAILKREEAKKQWKAMAARAGR